MTLSLEPTLWAAVLFGAVSVGWAGFSWVKPWEDRLESTVAPLQARFPKGRFRFQRFAIPTVLVFFLVLLLLWMKDHLFTALCLIAMAALGRLLSKRLPRWRKTKDENDRRRRCIEVFPQALEMTVQTLKVGQTLPQAVLYLAKESPSPLRDEFASVSAEMELGSSPEEALSKFADRLNHPDASRFLEAYRLSRRTGANLVHLYQIQLEGIEEKHRLMRRLDSMTAQARLSGLLMGALPVMLLCVLFVMDSDLLRPLVEVPAGWAVLALAVVLESLGFLWIKKLLQVDL